MEPGLWKRDLALKWQQGTQIRKTTREGIRKLELWFLKSWFFGNPEKLIKNLGKFADWCLYYAGRTESTVSPGDVPGFIGWTREGITFPWATGILAWLQAIPKKSLSTLRAKDRKGLCQLSLLKRGRPTGSGSLIQEALDKHENAMSTPWLNENEDLWCEYFSELTRVSVLKAHQRRKGLTKVKFKISAAGCLESSRKNWGKLGVVYEELLGFMNQDLTPLFEEKAMDLDSCDPFGSRLFPPGCHPELLRRLHDQIPIPLGQFLYREEPELRDLGSDYEISPELKAQVGTDKYLSRYLLLSALDKVLRDHIGKDLGPHAWFFAEKYSLELDRVPEYEAIVIPEQGWKVRIATKGRWGNTVLGTVFQNLGYWVLENDPITSGTLTSGYKLFQFLVDLEKLTTLGKISLPKNWVFLSSDLTSATDLIPSTILKAIHSELYAPLFPKDSFMNRINRFLMGPCDMTREDNGSKRTFRTVVGQRMGDTPSWPALNVYNRGLFQVAKKLSKSRIQSTEEALRACISDLKEDRLSVGKSFSATCGDDLIAACGEKDASNYTRLVQETNGKISEGSHLTGVVGTFTGSFCYKQESLRKTKPQDMPAWKTPREEDLVFRKAEYWDLVKVKPFLQGHSSDSGIPYFWHAGAAVASAAPYWAPERIRKVAFQMVHQLYAPQIRKIRFAFPIASRPRWAGGLGYPRIDLKDQLDLPLEKRAVSKFLLRAEGLEWDYIRSRVLVDTRIVSKFPQTFRIQEPQDRQDLREKILRTLQGMSGDSDGKDFKKEVITMSNLSSQLGLTGGYKTLLRDLKKNGFVSFQGELKQAISSLSFARIFDSRGRRSKPPKYRLRSYLKDRSRQDEAFKSLFTELSTRGSLQKEDLTRDFSQFNLIRGLAKRKNDLWVHEDNESIRSLSQLLPGLSLSTEALRFPDACV